MPARGVPLGPDAAQPIGALTLAAYNSSEVASERMKLTDLAGNAVTCNIETFDNQIACSSWPAPARLSAAACGSRSMPVSERNH